MGDEPFLCHRADCHSSICLLYTSALRLLLYLRYYQYGDDRMERSLRMLKSEVGSIIAPELYHTAELEADAILAMM